MACVPSTVTLWGTTQTSRPFTSLSTVTSLVPLPPVLRTTTRTTSVCPPGGGGVAGGICMPEEMVEIETSTPLEIRSRIETRVGVGLVTDVIPLQTRVIPCRGGAEEGEGEGGRVKVAEAGGDGFLPGQFSDPVRMTVPATVTSGSASSGLASSSTVTSISASASAGASQVATALAVSSTSTTFIPITIAPSSTVSDGRSSSTVDRSITEPIPTNLTSQSDTNSQNRKATGGIIAGSVMGALVAVFVLALLVLCWKRRRAETAMRDGGGNGEYWENRFRELEGGGEKGKQSGADDHGAGASGESERGHERGPKRLHLSLDLASKALPNRPASRLSAISSFFRKSMQPPPTPKSRVSHLHLGNTTATTASVSSKDERAGDRARRTWKAFTVYFGKGETGHGRDGGQATSTRYGGSDVASMSGSLSTVPHSPTSTSAPNGSQGPALTPTSTSGLVPNTREKHISGRNKRRSSLISTSTMSLLPFSFAKRFTFGFSGNLVNPSPTPTPALSQAQAQGQAGINISSPTPPKTKESDYTLPLPRVSSTKKAKARLTGDRLSQLKGFDAIAKSEQWSFGTDQTHSHSTTKSSPFHPEDQVLATRGQNRHRPKAREGSRQSQMSDPSSMEWIRSMYAVSSTHSRSPRSSPPPMPAPLLIPMIPPSVHLYSSDTDLADHLGQSRDRSQTQASSQSPSSAPPPPQSQTQTQTQTRPQPTTYPPLVPGHPRADFGTASQPRSTTPGPGGLPPPPRRSNSPGPGPTLGLGLSRTPSNHLLNRSTSALSSHSISSKGDDSSRQISRSGSKSRTKSPSPSQSALPSLETLTITRSSVWADTDILEQYTAYTQHPSLGFADPGGGGGDASIVAKVANPVIQYPQPAHRPGEGATSTGPTVTPLTGSANANANAATKVARAYQASRPPKLNLQQPLVSAQPQPPHSSQPGSHPSINLISRFSLDSSRASYLSERRHTIPPPVPPLPTANENENVKVQPGTPSEPSSPDRRVSEPLTSAWSEDSGNTNLPSSASIYGGIEADRNSLSAPKAKQMQRQSLRSDVFSDRPRDTYTYLQPGQVVPMPNLHDTFRGTAIQGDDRSAEKGHGSGFAARVTHSPLLSKDNALLSPALVYTFPSAKDLTPTGQTDTERSAVTPRLPVFSELASEGFWEDWKRDLEKGTGSPLGRSGEGKTWRI